MEPELIDGKILGAFLIFEAPGRKDEYGAVEGIASWDGHQLAIVRSEDVLPFPIPENAYGRIKPIDAKMRIVFETAEFHVALIVGPSPDDADLGDMK